VFLENEPSEGLFVLLEGRMQLCKLSPAGQISILAVYEPVRMLNEVSALDQGPNPLTVIALEDSLVWNMSPHGLEALLLRYPVVSLGRLRMLANRNRRLVARFEDLSFRSVLARAAKLLLELSAEGQRAIDRRKHPNYQLAARIATVPEAFSRSLKVFRQAGAIHCSPQQIYIRDGLHLRQVAQVGPHEAVRPPA
jgi:CRP-like cAMP-binding protein